jgi:hypothetical protein
MSIQAVVSHHGLRRPVVPAASVGCTGRSGRIYFSCAGVQSDNYWSSTTNADNTDNAWNVNLNNGNVNNDDKTNTNYVWPVRGGEWWSCCPYFFKEGSAICLRGILCSAWKAFTGRTGAAADTSEGR